MPIDILKRDRNYGSSFMDTVASFLFIIQNHNFFLLSCSSPVGLHTFTYVCMHTLAQSFIPCTIRKEVRKGVRFQPVWIAKGRGQMLQL